MNAWRASIVAMTAAMALASPAEAEIFHCRDGHGKTLYQEAPCSRAAGQTRVERAEPRFEKAPDAVGQTLSACLKHHRVRLNRPNTTTTARTVRDTGDGPPLLILNVSSKNDEGAQVLTELRCKLKKDLTFDESANVNQ